MDVTEIIFLDLQEKIKALGVSMDDLSRRSKIPLSTLYRRFDRKDRLTLVEYNALCKALKVVPVNIACNDKEVELLRLFRKLSDEDQLLILAVASAMSRSNSRQ